MSFFTVKTLFPLLRLYFQQTNRVEKCLRGSLSNETTDEELMLLYSRESNIKAFEILLNRYRSPVFGFAMKSVGDREIAEDIYQETFLRLIKSASAYKRTASFKTWVFTILKNLLRDHYRREKIRSIMRTSTHNDPDDPPGPLAIYATDAPNPEKLAESREISEMIDQALKDLPEEQREIFLLREEAGLDFQQAAKVAGCSVNTAKSRMRYALLKLQDGLIQRGIVMNGTRSV